MIVSYWGINLNNSLSPEFVFEIFRNYWTVNKDLSNRGELTKKQMEKFFQIE